MNDEINKTNLVLFMNGEVEEDGGAGRNKDNKMDLFLSITDFEIDHERLANRIECE